MRIEDQISDGYDDGLLDEEQIIDEFMGENPRARELRLMRAALEQRRAGFARERARSPLREQPGMSSKIAELDRQIAALRQEEEITSFVEGSVRVTLRNTPPEGLDY